MSPESRNFYIRRILRIGYCVLCHSQLSVLYKYKYVPCTTGTSTSSTSTDVVYHNGLIPEFSVPPLPVSSHWVHEVRVQVLVLVVLVPVLVLVESIIFLYILHQKNSRKGIKNATTKKSVVRRKKPLIKIPSRTLPVLVVGGVVLDMSSSSSSLSGVTVSSLHHHHVLVVPPPSIIIISPLAHAIGGSIGTALAMLLLYPLERVRIELQLLQKQQQNHQQQQQQQQQQYYRQQQPTSISSSSSMISRTKSTKQARKKNNNLNSCLVQQSQQQESCSTSSNDNSFSNTQKQQQQQQTTTACNPPVNNDKIDNNNPGCGTSNSKRFEFIQCIVRLWNEQTLYRGVNSVVLTMAISNFLFFYINEYLKKQFLQSTSDTSTSAAKQQSQKTTIATKLVQFYTKIILQQISTSTVDESIKVLLSLCIAGIINVILTNPLWVTNLRIMTNDNAYDKLDSSSVKSNNTVSFFYELVSIINNEGLSTLWSGTGASILLVSNPIIQFYTYYLLKKNCMPRTTTSSITGSSKGTTTISSKSHIALLSFLFGGISKIIATILTYPLQLAQSLQRLESKVNTTIDKQQQQYQQQYQQQQQQQNRNNVNVNIDKNNVLVQQSTTCQQKIHILQYLYYIYITNGIQGLYRGMDTKLIQTALTAALTFVTYEEIVLLIQQQINIISGV